MTEQQTPEQAEAFVKPDTDRMASIVDNMLNLDRLQSGDVRRAEKTARFATRPDLEADIEDLEAELETLVDDRGNPLTPAGEQSIGEPNQRTAATVAAEIQALQRAYAASFEYIRLRQMDGVDWSAFKIKWRDAIEGDDDEKRNEMLDALVVACAVRPELTADQWAQFRRAYGGVATEVVRATAWRVNTASGVDVPKSPLSSLVLKRQMLEQS